MGKLLINFSDPQETWLRSEVERQALPGGVSELVRRAIDHYRSQQETPVRTPSIPQEVLDKITTHRPHLAAMVGNLQANPSQAQVLEKRIADAYLAGETLLTPIETWRLSFCTTGDPYGGKS